MAPEENDANVAALRRWLNGEDAAFDEWLGSQRIEAGPRGPGRGALLDSTIRRLIDKPRWIRNTRSASP